METETLERIPNTQPINFRNETDKPKKASGKSAKDYRIERDELQAKLDEANEKIENFDKELKNKYSAGYQAGINKGQQEPNRNSIDQAWYERAQAAEHQVKKLKALLGEVTKVIVEGAL